MHLQLRFLPLILLILFQLHYSSSQFTNKTNNKLLNELISNATNALSFPLLTITNKTQLAISNDSRDYVTQAPYFWPDPNKPNGLPYLRRDGERNPESYNFTDRSTLLNFTSTFQYLTLAYYFTGEEYYAEKATQMLRTFIVNNKTRMNPHMEYAQQVPGKFSGRSLGIIESRWLARNVASLIELLYGSKYWSIADQIVIEKWFNDFSTWLKGSKFGVKERAANNNHGTFYDVQLVSYLIYIGDCSKARDYLENFTKKRIGVQIMPNGTQPHELDRTISWDYCNFNLEGLIWLSELGDKVGIDLWNSHDQRIRKALEFLYPYAMNEKKWEYTQIHDFNTNSFFSLMHRAALHYQDEKFKEMIAAIPPLSLNDLQIISIDMLLTRLSETDSNPNHCRNVKYVN